MGVFPHAQGTTDESHCQDEQHAGAFGPYRWFIQDIPSENLQSRDSDQRGDASHAYQYTDAA
jgi:hypothetical protein